MASVFTIQTGQTLKSHESFKSRLPWWSYKDVSHSTDCDVILAFCPLTSRVGTDIEAALREIPEGKPLAFVVLHHTNDSNYTVPDTGRFVRRPDSITVDCLFSDDGLMECPYNNDAVKAVSKFLGQHSKHSLRGKLTLGLLMVALIVMFVATVCPDFTLTYMLHGQNMISVEEFELKIKQSSKELENANEKVNFLEEERTASQQKVKELENKNNEYELEMQRCSKELEKVNKKVNCLEEELRALQQNVEELENKNEELKLEMERGSKELEKVNKKVNSLEEELRASQHKFEELESKTNKIISSLMYALITSSLFVAILLACFAVYYVQGKSEGRDGETEKMPKQAKGVDSSDISPKFNPQSAPSRGIVETNTTKEENVQLVSESLQSSRMENLENGEFDKTEEVNEKTETENSQMDNNKQAETNTRQEANVQLPSDKTETEHSPIDNKGPTETKTTKEEIQLASESSPSSEIEVDQTKEVNDKTEIEQ